MPHQMNYASWRRAVDSIIGCDVRERLSHTYSFLSAWKNEQLSPREACADAIARLKAGVDKFDKAGCEAALVAYIKEASAS